MFHTIVSIKNDGHYFCRAGGNRPDGLNEPVTDVEDEKTLLVPFKAEGPEGKRMYYGMYHCEEGYVEYAND
ncbi:hypothetical protein GT027_22180 [Escherichia coli]|nr:hypothetical protein [Escherichia coli]